MADKVKIGIIGAGNIFPAYVRGCRQFDILEISACADQDRARAEAAAAEHDIPKALPVEALLADPDIRIVANLTNPGAHAAVSLAILAANKHLYSEKPLAVTLDEGRRILAAAAARRLRVACAPDTFLGDGHQICRKLIDEGAIGEPVAAAAFMVSHGPEAWHPNPDFFYQGGAGPMMDMGPYYITNLVHLMGPVRRVTGSTRITFPERLANSVYHQARRIPVRVPTHYAAVLDFANGAIATLITSFDMWAAHLPWMEIYGSAGTLSAPNPNIFDGEVKLWQTGKEHWQGISHSKMSEVDRGIGLADLAYAVMCDRQQRCHGELAFHVLEVMQAVEAASASGRHVAITSSCERPAPLPADLPAGALDCR